MQLLQKKDHWIAEYQKYIYDEMKKGEEANINVECHLSTQTDDQEYSLAVCEYCLLAEMTKHNIWINDSGVSSHMIKSLKRVTDLKDKVINICSGDGWLKVLIELLISKIKSSIFVQGMEVLSKLLWPD
jgi:hypothetical protein